MYKRFISFILIFCFVTTIIPINNYAVKAKTKSAWLLLDNKEREVSFLSSKDTFKFVLPRYKDGNSNKFAYIPRAGNKVIGFKITNADSSYVIPTVNGDSGRIHLFYIWQKEGADDTNPLGVVTNDFTLMDEVKNIYIDGNKVSVDSIGVQMMLYYLVFYTSSVYKGEDLFILKKTKRIFKQDMTLSKLSDLLFDKAYPISNYLKDVEEFYTHGNDSHYEKACKFANEFLQLPTMRNKLWGTDSPEDYLLNKYKIKDNPGFDSRTIDNPWEYMVWYMYNKTREETEETEEEIDTNVTENLATLDTTKMTYKEWVETVCWFARGEEKDRAGNVFDYNKYKDGLISNTVLKREEKAVIYGILQGLCKYNSTYNGNLIPTFSKDENDRKLLNQFDLRTMLSFLSGTSVSTAYKSELDFNLLGKEAVKSSLAEIKSVGTAISDNHMARMLTFNSRLTYLASNASEDSEVDEKVIDYYTDSTNQSMCPDSETLTLDTKYLPEATRGKDNGAICFALYIATMNEMYYFYKDSTVAIYNELKANRDRETVSSDLKHWATALDEVRKGVEFSQQSTLSNLWTKKNIDAGDKSLEDMYEELKGMVGDLQSLNELSDANIKHETGDALTEFFASIPEGKLNDYVLKGISYSASYIPMKTNLYDPITLNDYNTEFLQNFFYKYGFMRKALYIDSAKDSAEELRNTGLKGETRVCTLKDLVDPAGDITLYIDRNFYNANELADLLGESYDKITNNKEAEESTEQTVVEKWWTKLTDNIEEVFETSFQNQVRTGGIIRYSDRLRNRIANQTDSGYIPSAGIKDSTNSATSDEDSRADDNKDSIVLTSGRINEILEGTSVRNKNDGSGAADVIYDGYSVLLPYAVVSALYRDGQLFNYANDSTLDSPVFIASFNTPNITNATEYEKNEIFNYLLLKNLKTQMPVGYETSLDIDSPVYMDVFGNILTESGYVVVPAASNATLFTDDYDLNIYAMALPYCYGTDYTLEGDEVSDTLKYSFERSFTLDTLLDEWKVRSRVIDDTVVDYARLSIADGSSREAVTKGVENYLADPENIQFRKYVNIILEVMRGAPIENIDKAYEDLNTNRTITKAGLATTHKLEVLNNALGSADQNTILSIPNIAFVDGFEYIALFTFKALMLITLVALMFTLFGDIFSGKISFGTPLKCLTLLLTVVLSVVTIPQVFDISYYQANKMFLQDETEYIAMLNEEKRKSGAEVGVFSVSEPDISTTLYVKLDNVYVPWYDIFDDIMLSSTFKNLDDVYEHFTNDSPIATQPDVMVMNDGMYMPLDTLFDSTSINTTTDNLLQYNVDASVTTAAYYSPYYVFLERLTSLVNWFNLENNWKAYTTTLQRGGKIKTIGAVQGFFTDVQFMEAEGDILGLARIYLDEGPSLENLDVWSDADIDKMRKSQWCNTLPGYEATIERMDLITKRAQRFVAKNKGLIGKVSDETFLEIMALDLAMYHNSIFGVDSCNAIEIDKLSSDDLLRMVTGTREEVMYDSSLNYPRFVYEVGGTVAVYTAALLTLVNFVIGYLKPICTVVIMIAIYTSLFIFKVCLQKKSASIYGYIITTFLLCVLNFVYALAMKASMYMPQAGLNPAVCMIIAMLIQIVYAALLLKVTVRSLVDWRDLGYAKYQYEAQKKEDNAKELLMRFKRTKHLFAAKKYNESPTKVYQTNNPEDNWGYYNNLSEARKRRKKVYRRR